MIDEAIQIDKKLTPAQAAVRYMLERIRVDADLRWHLLNTEALVRLTLAEAVRTGGTRHAVEAHYTTPACHGLPAEAITRCPVCRAIQCGDVGNALELCPACAGLGIDVVSRCPMCRKLLEAL